MKASGNMNGMPTVRIVPCAYQRFQATIGCTEPWPCSIGTCASTIEPECYGSSFRQGQDVIDYFQKIVQLFRELPTYSWLAAGKIPLRISSLSHLRPKLTFI